MENKKAEPEDFEKDKPGRGRPLHPHSGDDAPTDYIDETEKAKHPEKQKDGPTAFDIDESTG